MPGFETFARDLQLATAGLEPVAIAAQLARFARAELADAIQRGEASPTYARFVNGREGAPEESVVPPGPILYVFSAWGEIIPWALADLEKRSPRKSGAYAFAHIVMVGGRPVSDPSAIDPSATVNIVNTQPYSRKIEFGHMRMSVPSGVYEAAAVAIERQFKDAVDVRWTQVQLPNGYVLKGRGRRSKPGERMTYPALQLKLSAVH